MTDRLVHTVRLDGREVAVFERSAMIPNPALSMIPTPQVVETFYKCEAPDWPMTRIRARRGVTKLLYRFGRRPGLPLDDDTFNASYRVDTEDDDFAIVLLSPEMQRFMLTKRSADWSAGHGFVKLFYRGKLKRNRMVRSLERLRRFWTLVPPELLEWVEESDGATQR